MLIQPSLRWFCNCGWCLAVVLVASALLRGAAAADTAEAAAASELRLKNSADYLASDGLEGRGVGTKGLDLAADFLASEFAKAGLKTDLFDGAPYQKFSIVTAVNMGDKAKNRLLLIGPPEREGSGPRRIELELGKSFSPLAIGGSGQVAAPLVFVGYGITAKDLQKEYGQSPSTGQSAKDEKKPIVYDEYEGIDVKGKIVVVIRKEPQQESKDSLFNGDSPSRHAAFSAKISNAFEHGAAAVVLVNDGLEISRAANAGKQAFEETVDRLVEARRKFKELVSPSEADRQKHAAEVGQLAEQIAQLSKPQPRPENPDVPLAFDGAGIDASRRSFPVVFSSRQPIDEVIQSALHRDLAAIEQGIDASLKPQSGVLTGWSAEIQTDVVYQETEVKNVVGVLEGEGPLADETIIIGAHYDHLGFGGSGSLAPWTTAIHNGADDNASGTATLLEIAHRLASSGKKPQRRIVFIAFTGEERGLLGSAHYVRQPRFPLEKTIAMFNLDMVGRLNSDKLTVFGTATAKTFDSLVEQACHEAGMQLVKFEGALGRDQLSSDHVSFYNRKIPALHFFTGTHTDYHRPSDDADKLNVPGMRRIADVVVKVVEATDAAAERPQYVEVKRSGSSSVGGVRGVSLGTMPDYSAQVEGVALSGVRPGSPADMAGMKAGDILIQLGDSRIGNIDDFMNALMKHKPGEDVQLTVKREGKEVRLKATLAPSGGR